ncbi:MAG TPA: peptide ABC transporter substrate-binding protein [Candidatus Eisenbergiella merdipullorum]|uniref:Peptide ABC transporter substrate-binding protein n=1 Tax=Candidatus Eisenbergiella merdipullorum TaxID=2838553 RepID=A0A9D2I5N2_9FIRM|nr:peptide ABC transporter substrate-binding protein [Candidatus Eisenbergiella merdipullorum]
MKKKYLAFLLAASMVVGTLAGCGSSTSTTESSAAAETTVESAAESTAAAESTEASTEAATEEAAASGEHGPSSEAAPAWEDYDARIDQIRAETDLAAREALMHEAEDELMSTWAIMPLYYYNDVYMQSQDVDNIYANLYGYKYFAFATAPGNTLSLQIASEPDKLDPALNSTVDGACLAILAFSGLYTYDENGQLVPDLAESVEESDDAMTYTFTMKDGLMWSDGTPLTAADVEYSWQRLANPDTGADYSYLADVIAKNDDGTLQVEASEDGKTFTVQLTAPCPYFLDLCAFPAFYPVPQAAVEGADGYADNPGAWCTEAGFVSSGPFVCTGWTHNESMTYEKNPNYYNADAVTLERIDFMLSDDDTAVWNAFMDGSLQFIDSIGTDNMETAKGMPEYHNIPTLGTYYAGFNVNSPIFDGKTVQQAADMRKAMNLLVDRQYIVDTIAQADQEIANTFIPTGMSDGHGGEFRANDDAYTYPDEAAVGYFDPSPEAYDANVEEARTLLEGAGYEFDENGMLSADTPINLTYLTNEGTGNVAIGEALQQDFAVIGINLTIETREWSVFLNERKDGQFDFAREGWIADYNDPINMLEMWTTNSGNNDMQFGR